jgi:hypothetical protein
MGWGPDLDRATARDRWCELASALPADGVGPGSIGRRRPVLTWIAMIARATADEVATTWVSSWLGGACHGVYQIVIAYFAIYITATVWRQV